MAATVALSSFRQRFRSGLSVVRGQQIAMPHAAFELAVKRAAMVIFIESLYGRYGEPPPAEVEATPVLFRTSEAVKAAVEEFANKIATTPMHLYNQINAEGEKEEVKAHPGLTVIRNPNPFLTRWLLKWNTVADLKLSGNAFWFLAGPANGQPQEIWRCNPRFTRIVRSKEKFIAGYITEIDGKMIPLDVNEVIHFKRPNVISEDDLYGLSDLAPAARAAQTGVDMATWNRKMFARDQAVPAGVVNIEDNMSDTDFERLKAEWLSSYGGGKRRTAFFRGGKIQFQPIGLSQTDVDFLNGSKWEMEKVYRSFGTYHLLPGQNADDRKINERQFLENHAWALMTYIAEVISDQFFGFWGKKDGVGLLTTEFEDIRPRERALDLQEEQEEMKGLTFNEWREKRGLETLVGGDDVLFVHVQSGEKLKFEVDALPEPEPVPAPLQPTEEKKPENDTQSEDAQERAERRGESAGNEVGDKIGESTDKSVSPDAIHRELHQWEKFTSKRKGTEHEREFIPEAVPHFIAVMIKTALAACEPGAVKAVFETAHELIDGKLPIKSSYGVPDGTVVLYLSGVEDVLLVQQALQRSVASDAPFRWTPREQLHITLVHCPMVDEPDYRQISQETGPFSAFAVRGIEITTFEGEGGAVPIVALVEPTDELRALQADLWADFAARGIAVSEYSQPDNWKPHITLGYAEQVEFSGLNYGPYSEFGCTADTLTFTRGSFENLYSRVGTPVLIALPDVNPETAATYKAIQATRLDFETDFESVLAAGRAGDIDRRAWANRMRTLLRKYGEKAYRDGLHDGGVVYNETEPLDPDDRTEFNGMLATQSQFVTELGRVVFRTERGISDGQAAVKPELWFNKSIMPFYQAGLLSADKNGLYLWGHNPLKKNCLTCLTASGQIHRLKDWYRREIKPQSSNLLCGGWACGCLLIKASGRALGRLDSIPTAGLKAGREHSEGQPMVDKWPESLPAEIVKEFTRVLGQRVVDVAVQSDTYTMTLREEAGYYAPLPAETVQQGLTMIDRRLKLVDHKVVNDTDISVNFRVEDDNALQRPE